MPRTIPPDSLGATGVPRGPDDRRSDLGTTQHHHDDFPLVRETQAYLACLARGDIPGPAQMLAWDRFYRTYAPLVVRTAERRPCAGSDPDDLVQDAWQVIIARLAAFRPDPGRGAFRSWLLVVVRHRLADRARGELRRVRPTTWGDPPDHLEGSEDDPVTALEREEERARFRELLAQLQDRVTPLCYRVLQLRTLEGRSVTEVAQLVGLSADRVRTRHHRTIARLRQLAGPDVDETRRGPGLISQNISVGAQQDPAA